MNTIESNTRLRGSKDNRRNRIRDWVYENSRKYSAKEIARDAGLSVKGAEKVRAGDNGIGAEPLVKWCLSNPSFREEFIAFLRSDPWTVAGAARPLNYEASYGDPDVDGPLPGSVAETEALMHTFGGQP